MLSWAVYILVLSRLSGVVLRSCFEQFTKILA